MDPLSLVRGAVIGLSIAAPIGPVGILCIRRTLAQGFGVGVASGLGAATVHAIYGALALYGVAAVAAFVLTHRAWLLAADIAVLLWLGHRIFRAAPQERCGPAGQGVLRAYVSTFSLAVVNPMTVLAFASWVAGLTAGGAGAEDEPLAALGIFLGSILWWVVLTGAAAVVGSRLRVQQMRWINRLSGATIWAFAGMLLGRAFS